METVYDKIENGVIVNSIVASAEEVAALDGTWELRVVTPLTAEETGRAWRNGELRSTDWIVSITDHPQRSSYLTYRANLRDWPSTSDFPNTKPTL